MGSVTAQHQRVGRGSRKDRMGRTDRNLFWIRWFNLLLLLCFIKYSETSGNTPRSVTGEEGGNVTLSCDFEAKEISDVILSRFSKNILVCQNEECKSENGRLLKKGSCDVSINDLIFSDAGKYILRVYYTDDQTEVERQILEYHLHIHAETTVKRGKPLKMDVLLSNAEKVEKNSSGELTEVWTRGHGVTRDGLTDRDGNLTINNFTSTDSGTYIVLDSEGEILITFTVTASNTGSKGKLDTDEDKTNAAVYVVPSVFGALVLLALVISAVVWRHQHQDKKPEHEAVPMKDREQQNI